MNLYLDDDSVDTLLVRLLRHERTAKYRFELLIPSSYNDRRPV